MNWALNQLGRLRFVFTTCFAPCIFTGAIFALVASLLDKEPHVYFPLGFGVAVLPVWVWARSPRRLRGLMETVREWREAGFITQAQEREFCREVLAFFRRAEIGEPPPEPEDGPPVA